MLTRPVEPSPIGSSRLRGLLRLVREAYILIFKYGDEKGIQDIYLKYFFACY